MTDNQDHLTRSERLSALGDQEQINVLHFLVGYLSHNEAFCKVVDEQLDKGEAAVAARTKPLVMVICPSCRKVYGHTLGCSLRPRNPYADEPLRLTLLETLPDHALPLDVLGLDAAS